MPALLDHTADPAVHSNIWREKLAQLAVECQVTIKWLVKLDTIPFTLNDHYFNDVRTKIHAHLRDERYPKAIVPASGATGYNGQTSAQNVASALAALAALGYNGLAEADLKKLRPVDDYETEIEVMAETRAYFQIAFKVCSALRLVDSRCAD
jgi:hypothetical protein